MSNQVWKWALGLVYILAVATIWIAASFVVQSVVDDGVSPFLVTYICNSLFVVYLPFVEIRRYLEDRHGSLLFWRNRKHSKGCLQESGASGEALLLEHNDTDHQEVSLITDVLPREEEDWELVLKQHRVVEDADYMGLDANGRWTCWRIARVSFLICPFWFLAQLTFNLSLKYTTVTSNTILSSCSSLFTFLVSLVFLGEKFTWLKLVSVLLCMGGSVTVSLGDSEAGNSAVASNPVLGDVLALVSAAIYAVYVTLIRKKLPDEGNAESGSASMAQFLGFLGLFNILIFLPVAVMLDLSKLEPFNNITWRQFGLIACKGLLDNVLSDYLWAKAVLLTTTTVATAGLTIQVPLAAVADSLTGNPPHLLDYMGAAAVMLGFAGISIPTDLGPRDKEADLELDN